MKFKEVGISGANFLSESGKPLLPSFGKFVQIPAHHDFEIDVEYGECHEFKDILITPAQEAAKDGQEDTEWEYDQEAYFDESLYPRKMVETGSIQQLDNYKVLPLYVRPLQYSAANKLLQGREQIKVLIKLTPKDAVEDDEEIEQFTNADPSIRREAYGNLLLNPTRSTLTRVVQPGIIPRPVLPFVRGPELLIIYDDNLQNQADKLSFWKNQRGMISETIPISKVGNNVDKIKTHIRNRRKAFFSRLRYVILFGDVANIVTEQDAGATTDHYYYTSRDAANNNDCVLPWVSGGRIPVTDKKTANKIVDQIIRYEKEPPRDPNYYKRMTFAAYFQDIKRTGTAERAFIKTMESIRQHLLALGFEINRVYVSETPNPQKYLDGTTVPADVRSAIVDHDIATGMMISDTSEGQMIIGHRDHGGRHGWAHPSFDNCHLKEIVNRYPSIFYSINCLTGQYDRDPADSFAEKILALDGGAPSLIAASEKSETWRNDSMMKAMFDALWPGVISTFPGSTVSYGVRHNRLGDILNYAKSYLLVAHGTNAGVKNHLEIYHVIGDPTLQLWCKEPKPVNLRTRVRNHKLYITTNICPADAVITLWKNKKLLRRVKLTSTMINIPLRELRPQPITPATIHRPRILSVCFSAPNHLFAKTHIRI